ncbi:hypothetical protein C0J52_11281 [Blattella germanica]|nr:hypothetical protein C0J52_11281 [Blattella germanica]
MKLHKMSNAPKKIGHRKRKSCDEAKLKEAITLRPREKGQFKGNGYQKQVKSTSTAVVEALKKNRCPYMMTLAMRNTKLAVKKFQNRVILNEFSAKQIFRRRTR